MKSFKIFFLIIFIPILLFSKDKITVAIDYEYSPITYKSFEGKPEGLLVEFWKLWGKRSGYDVKFKFYSWDDSIKAVKNGDVIFHSGLTPDKKWMVKSDEFYKIKTSFYKIKTKSISKNLVIGSIDEYYMELAKERYPEAKIVKYQDYLPMIKDMLDGKINLFIDDEVAINVFLLQKGVKAKFEVLNNSFVSDIYTITNKQNKKYINLFNKYLKTITLKDIVQIENDVLGKNNGFYNSENKIKLFFTNKELDWLSKNEVIKYVYDPDWAPFEFNNGVNIHSGIVADILKIIKEKSGIKFQAIPTSTWADSVKLAEDKKIDMYSAVLETEDRKKYMNYTSRYVFKYFGGLVARKTDSYPSNLKIEKSLIDKKIGLVRGNAIGEFMRDKYPNLTYIDLDSTQDGFLKLRDKSIDTFVLNVVSADYYINHNGFSDAKVISKLDFEFGLKIAISKDKPKEIISILNKVIDSIDKADIDSVYEKWVHTDEYVVLNNKEKNYIKQQIPIKYVYDPNREPFEYVNSLQNHSGITADILELITKKSGLKFEEIKTDSWKDSVNLIKNKKADMFSFVIETDERKKYLKFSDKVLFKVPLVFVNNIKDNNIYENIKFDLINKKIGIVKSRAIYKKLSNKFPMFHFIQLDSVEEGFEKVTNGEIDMFAVNKSTAKYYIKINGFSNVKIATSVDLFFEFKIAIQKSLPVEVLSILNKSLNSISELEINKIYNSYTDLKTYKPRTDWKLILQIGSIVLIIILFLIWNNKRLQLMVKEQTDELSLLLQEFNDNVIASKTDLTGKITYVSKAFCDICEYSEEELIGKPHNIVRHPDVPKEAFRDMWSTIQSGKIWTGEVKNLKKNGDYYWVDATIMPEFYKDGNIKGYSAIRHDITAKKEIEELTENLEKIVASRTNELNEERNFIGSIIKTSQDALVVIDQNSKITTFNRAATEIFGFSESEILGKSVLKIIPEEYRGLYKIGMKRINNTDERKLLNKGTLEMIGLHKCGNIVDIDLALSSFTINNQIFYSANIRDITERKQLLEKLEGEKKFIQTLLDSQEQIVVTTLNGKVESVNQRFLDFFKVSSIDEFKSNYNAKCICDTFNTEAPSEYIQKEVEGILWLDYLLINKDSKVMITVFEKNYIFSVNVANLPNKDGLKSAVFTNITDAEKAREEILAINKHTKDSIEYASLIQSALIPSHNIMRKHFKDMFVIWHPKDVVGGDIYLFEELREKDEYLLIVMDCTGHGVPGAFVTMLVKAIERQIVSKINNSDEIVSPAKLLSIFNKNMKQLLKQEDTSSFSNVGMDGQIIYYNKKEKIVKCASARNEIFYYQDDKLNVIKGDRHSIGYRDSDSKFIFKEHIIDVSKESIFYVSSDGYWDQNGGEKNLPFGKRRLKKMLDEIHNESMADQQEEFLYTFEAYKNNNIVNDDVTVVGFKI